MYFITSTVPGQLAQVGFVGAVTLSGPSGLKIGKTGLTCFPNLLNHLKPRSGNLISYIAGLA